MDSGKDFHRGCYAPDNSLVWAIFFFFFRGGTWRIILKEKGPPLNPAWFCDHRFRPEIRLAPAASFLWDHEGFSTMTPTARRDERRGRLPRVQQPEVAILCNMHCLVDA